MTNIKNQHIVPKQENWATEAEKAQKPSKLFENKHDAIDYASKIAKRNNGCIIVHDEKGKFQSFRCRDEIELNELDKIYPIDPIMGNMPI